MKVMSNKCGDCSAFKADSFNAEIGHCTRIVPVWVDLWIMQLSKHLPEPYERGAVGRDWTIQCPAFSGRSN